MPVRKPSPVTPSADLTDAQSTSTQKRCLYLPWKQLLKPFPLALFGLAIAVTLWGYGYKLSLYRPHPAPSSLASVAKMWDGPRNPSKAAASNPKTRSHLIPGSLALLAPSQPLLHASGTVALVFPVRTSSVKYLNSLIPSRSPPPYRFRLA